MRIGIDCRMAGNRHAGIGRYIAQLVQHLLAVQNADDWVLFFRDQGQVDEVLTKAQQSECLIVLADIRHYTIREQLWMPAIFKREHLDLLHVPHFNVPLGYRKPFVVTIHDLLWHDHRGSQVTTLPRWQYWTKYLFYRVVSSSAISRARAILVPTQTVAKTVHRFYPKSSSKVVVSYEGVEESFAPPKQVVTRPKQLLYVGSLYPHKNIEILLQALKRLPEFRLRIVSVRTVFGDSIVQRVRDLGIQNQVDFLGAIDDKTLQKEYHQADAVVCPSLSEGFGLPGIEALACGTSVVASDIPIFQEVYRKSALFFNPHQVNSLINALKKLTAPQKLKLRKSGLELVKRYRWSQTAQATLDTYHRL